MCVGFRYTSIVITPFFLVTRLNKKAIWPLFSVSMVNEMLGSMEFRVSWKAATESFLMMMTKMSSTQRFQILGGTVEIDKAEYSITSMQRFATTGLTGLPWICL